VDSEDITIETESIFWEDEKRTLSGSDDHPVDIQRSDGTVFSGRGFTANSRSRTWSFTGGVEGSYVDAETDDDEALESGENEVTEEELFRELEGLVLAPPGESSDAADIP
jgi:hypothetical protein